MIKKHFNKSTEALYEWLLDHPITAVLGLVVGTIVIVTSLVISINYSLGIDGFGPEEVKQVTINRLYVDGGNSSDYMVGTDQGVYEINNILLPIQLFNSDELYSKLEVGKTYTVKIKGNKVINWFMQQYPYIIEIK